MNNVVPMPYAQLRSQFGGLPESPVISAAFDYARERMAPFLFNHVARSWLFAARLARMQALQCDLEVVAVSTLLHDLGLTPHADGPYRFEVNGAMAAAAFVRDRGFDEHRAQLVWDCIALHATPSIGLFKEREVALCVRGITVDFGGDDYERIGRAGIDTIVAAMPRLDMKQQFTCALRHLAETRPETTYDTIVRDFGERYVPGYRASSWVDQVLGGPYAD
jgi:hypothetical protein